MISNNSIKNNNDKIYYYEIINYYLNKDYEIRSNILYNISSHLDSLYNLFIITNDDCKKILIKLNIIINDLNQYYNKIISTIDLSNINIHINKYNFKSKIKIIDILRMNNTTNIFMNDLNIISYADIDSEIKEICSYIGLKNVSDILLLYNIDLSHLSSYELELIHIIKSYAIPISVSYNNNNKTNNNTKYIQIYENIVNTDKYQYIMNTILTLKIFTKTFSNIIEINFIFESDPLNTFIRTSEIYTKYIIQQKKLIKDIFNSMTTINTNFKSIYIKNLSLSDYIIDISGIIQNKILLDYTSFISYSNMNFKTIMNEFLQCSLKQKFKIIKLLLMGSTTSINTAALLFGITKDQKDSLDINSKPTLISDLIYQNLKFTNQLKLKKSNLLINQELDKLKNLSIESIDLKKQILINKNIPEYVKKILMSRLDELKLNNSEHYKQQMFIKKIIDFPWDASSDNDMFSLIKHKENGPKKFLDDAKENMNKLIYGHTNSKETILELIGKWISNPKSIGRSIGLKGPPGVGKTLFAKSLGKILNIPFSQYNVGGLDDASILTGHSFTYSSAQNGIIIDNMITAGSARCIMFFDEIDKTGNKNGQNEIMNVLIHLTDPNTNDKFNDNFFQEISFPLNKVLFVFSYNDADKVDKILLDRLEQIEISAYTSEDKVKIFENHLLKEVILDIGLDANLINFELDAISYLIDTYTFEAGIRGLKRKLEKLLYKINLEILYGEEKKLIIITKNLIDKYLEKPSLDIRKIMDIPQIGIINGLYAMTSGPGGILPILIYKNFTSDKFQLKLTGSQKNIMKESVKFSFTIAMTLIKELYQTKFIEEHPKGLHIHTPDGATPKDGPSAGAAFTTAFISKILDIPIKNNIAMTGEIETNGNITAIGGLECKLLGAKKAGVNLVFVPKANKNDYDKIIIKNPDLFTQDFQIRIVSNIKEVLEYALIDLPNLTTLSNNDYKLLTYAKTFDIEKFLI
jgi:endopeptidase La